ncbi:MAG TPA: zinc transporter ZupT [Fusobacteriaceae bacterium]|nr:zinc transporter ZupT [Fusobacteriaceae bacterium]
MHENFYIAFGLTLFAGLATGIGSALAFFTKQTNRKFLSLSLGFSAGVMIYVSFVEIFVKAKIFLIADLGMVKGTWVTVISFFGGVLLIAIIDKLVPSFENPHELKGVEEMMEISNLENDLEQLEVKEKSSEDHKDFNQAMMRMGLFSALAIGIHNFPEGLATFVATLKDPSLGLPIAVAIAIHNIPEGIAISVPIYFATGNKKKAFFYSFLSGLAEPVGALVGYLILMPFLSDTVFGIIFSGIAGIMVFISLDELLPAAQKYGEHHLSIYGLISGMGVMALSLLLFI